MPTLRWLATLALSSLIHANDLNPVPIGHPWSWRPGCSEASDPPEAWRSPDYTSAFWLSGPSGFAQDYSQLEATILPVPAGCPSMFLRAVFTLEDPTALTWLILRLDYAGGFVAYLNGTEIAHRSLSIPHLPDAPVPFNTPALPHPPGTREEIDVSPALPLLRAGTNCLAIQWHNAPLRDWPPVLVPELVANFTRGPFLQATTPTSQRIVWKTHLPADTAVEYGPTPAFGRVRFLSAPTNVHVADLEDLEPDTLYHYRVSSFNGAQTALSPPLTFRTFRTSGPTRFSFMADVGSGNTNQYNVARVLRDQPTDLVLVGGDLVYPSFKASVTDFRFFSIYGPQMRHVPFFPVAGNHDVIHAPRADYYDAFFPPTNSVSIFDHVAEGTEPESYYSFDHGDVHFVAVYLPLLTEASVLALNSPQMRWLEADLAATRKPWKVLFLHHTLITSNGHRRDDYNRNGQADPAEVGALLLPVAQRHGVQLVINGHDHVYERSNPVLGVQIVTAGCGGGSLYYLTERDPTCAQFWIPHHFLHVTTTAETLHARAIYWQNAFEFDAFYIHRSPPPRQPYAAPWSTPRIETGRPDDTDGNILRQSFDFTDPGLATLPGDGSNLGRFHVSFDHTHLYLGFERVMLYADQTLYLFIESPRLPGVTTLAGLGNHQIDPLGQGVDGLDFLKNLSFTNFTPAFACLLGDELADGQYRSWQRTVRVPTDGASLPFPVVNPDFRFDTGQGVFRLDPAFSDIPDIQLQQYNRSPQLNPVPGEQNADFIELAIPLAHLVLQPGDRFRLGAVVGTGQVRTDPTAPARALDRAYLGYSLTGSGLNPVQLEGLEIELGPDLDPDGDGLLNAEEAQWRTDPQNADTDADGLPDGWEVRHGLNPLSSADADGPTGDPDGDDHRNVEEFLAATHPRDPRSVLRLLLTRSPNGHLQFSWPSAPGRRYQLQSAPRPDEPFTDLPGPDFPRLGGSGTEHFTLPIPPTSSATYYRLQLLP